MKAVLIAAVVLAATSCGTRAPAPAPGSVANQAKPSAGEGKPTEREPRIRQLVIDRIGCDKPVELGKELRSRVTWTCAGGERGCDLLLEPEARCEGLPCAVSYRRLRDLEPNEGAFDIIVTPERPGHADVVVAVRGVQGVIQHRTESCTISSPPTKVFCLYLVGRNGYECTRDIPAGSMIIIAAHPAFVYGQPPTEPQMTLAGVPLASYGNCSWDPAKSVAGIVGCQVHLAPGTHLVVVRPVGSPLTTYTLRVAPP